jgi:hypothetical protein
LSSNPITDKKKERERKRNKNGYVLLKNKFCMTAKATYKGNIVNTCEIQFLRSLSSRIVKVSGGS